MAQEIILKAVLTELKNLTPLADESMAEFLLSIHEDSKNLATFQRNLKENDAPFEEDFIEKIDKVINGFKIKREVKQEIPEIKLEQTTKYQEPNQEKQEQQHASGVNKRQRFIKDEDDDVDEYGRNRRIKYEHDEVDEYGRSRRMKYENDEVDEYGRKRRTKHERDNDDHHSENLTYQARDNKVDEYGRNLNSKYERDHLSINNNTNQYQPSRSAKPDKEAIEGKIYHGRVTKITNYGAFIQLDGIVSHRGRSQSGLCHISQFSNIRIDHPSDVVSANETVFVKITKIDNKGISLTMKNIDQNTGNEVIDEPQRGRTTEKTFRPKRKLTSPERWELRQLVASGAISAKELGDVGEDLNDFITSETGGSLNLADDVEIDIEVHQDEPRFLEAEKNFLKKSGDNSDIASLKIIPKPEGSLNRAAMTGSQLAKDLKEKKLKALREKRLKQIKKKTDDPLLNKDGDANDDDDELLSEWQKANKKLKISYGKKSDMSIAEQRKSLPVFKMRSKLLDLVDENQFLVIVGETGSGKTTQLTQYLMEDGYSRRGVIGCTQPRRVAAISVAKRVSEEVGCKLGHQVGYKVRFDDKYGPDTEIKYMTDGMLQREALIDPNMSKYSVIMLDEAHERTIATDVLFALLKKAARNRPDLKIIVTSATLDSDKFSRYFNDCPVLKIPGRTFPVEIMYTKEPELDYLAACLDTVLQIHVVEGPGDILVFLTGQEEIDTACEALYDKVKALGSSVPELIILPVYSSLPSEVQSRIFEPTPKGSRKCVIATNIAETSITIDGIYYVIDPGFVKINAYDPKLGMDSLVVSPISQAQANQRAGRAGRTGPGKCYRLFTESAFKNEMSPNTIPEIQRQNLSTTILMLKAMGIDDLINFEFMDPPPMRTLMVALEELFNLSALDQDGNLTKLGNKMADFPMDPALAKSLIVSSDLHCSDELTTIVAMLSVQTIFYRPKHKQQQADLKKSKFHSTQGDHLTLLNTYNAWAQNDYSRTWCEENYIQERSLKRARDVRNQLIKIFLKYKHSVSSCGRDYDRIRVALCSGFFKNSAKRDSLEPGAFKTLIEDTPVYMHPSSCLFGKRSEYVIYHTLLLTTKEYMHCVTTIEPQWLIEVAPTFFKVGDGQKKKSGKIVSLKRNGHKRLAPR